MFSQSSFYRSLLLLALILGVTSPALAYSGGSGTNADPYQVATKSDLLALAATTADYGKSFIMVADVNLAGETFTTAVIAPDTNNVTAEFQGTAFTGVFDGNDHSITGLTINNGGTGNDFLGLFGCSSGTIMNLTVLDSSILGSSGSMYVGALVGWNNAGNMSDCGSSGNVIGGSRVGGLIGRHFFSRMNRCWSTASVTGLVDYVGGLAAMNSPGSTISQCYATGQVRGVTYVGGLVAYNPGVISNCYAIGSVSGTSYVGGLVATNYGSVAKCYSVGGVSGSSYSGGLVGYISGGTTTNSFWDTQASGKTTSAGGTGKTTAQMKTLSTFTSPPANWDFTNETGNGSCDYWMMPTGGGYPVFSFEIVPFLSVSPLGVFFAKSADDANPVDQSFSIRNAGPGILEWQIAGGSPSWLEIIPTSGQSAGETNSITVRVNTAGLTRGLHSTDLTVRAPGVTGSPQVVHITLSVDRIAGRVVGWGQQVRGVDLSGGFVGVSAGCCHSLGLKVDGSIVAWGRNERTGQCIVPSPNTGFISVAAGYYHSLGLKRDGSVVAWGDCSEVPSPNTGFTAIAAGRDYSAALRADGSIVAWGYNNYGECDVPSPNAGFVAVATGEWHCLGLKDDSSIVAWGDNGAGQCNVPVPNTDFIVVAAGDSYSVGLKSDGTIVAWGDNTYGQCDVPHPNGGFADVAAGDGFCVGLKMDGSIVCWGYNGFGQCNVPVPNTGFVAVAAGNQHSIGLKSDGSVVAWGWDYYGQCDLPLPNAGFVATDGGHDYGLGLRSNGSIVGWGYNDYGQCTVPGRNEYFTAVAAGGYHSLGLRADSSVLVWGEYGQCNVPVPNMGFMAIDAGEGYSLGLKTDGSIVVWGDNLYGQCNVPTPNSGFVAIAAGGYHGLGLKADGSIVAWGSNWSWDYDIGPWIAGQCNVPSPNADFVAIAAGKFHSIGLLANGSVIAWGDNSSGQCNVPSPNEGFVGVAAGQYHSVGLKRDGSVVTWGDNTYSQHDILGPNTGFVAIAADGYKTLAIRNLKPVAQAGADRTAYADHTGKASAKLDGSGSSDPENDPLTYLWSWSVAGEDFNSTEPNFTTELPVGVHVITLVVSDGLSTSEPNTCTITVTSPMDADLMMVPRVLNAQAHQRDVAAILRIPGITRADLDPSAPITLWPFGIQAKRKMIFVVREQRRVYPVILAFFDTQGIFDATPRTARVSVQVETKLRNGCYAVGSDNIMVIQPPKHRR